MTGISLIDFNMKIDKRTSQSTIININITTPNILVDHEALEYTFWTIPDTIDEKIRSEIPFEIPFSVINSPIRIKITDPTVIANAVARSVGIEVLMTLPPRR